MVYLAQKKHNIKKKLTRSPEILTTSAQIWPFFPSWIWHKFLQFPVFVAFGNLTSPPKKTHCNRKMSSNLTTFHIPDAFSESPTCLYQLDRLGSSQSSPQLSQRHVNENFLKIHVPALFFQDGNRSPSSDIFSFHTDFA